MGGTELREILVPLDGSGTAEWALPLAARIARRAGARIRLIRVFTSLSRTFPDITAAGYLEEWEDRERQREAEYVGSVTAHLRDTGLDVQSATASGSPVHEIVEAAAEADLVVLTAHGWSGPERAWLGNVADGVLHHVRMPVLVVRAEATEAPARPYSDDARLSPILVATDGTAAARAAEDHAADLARLFDARLVLYRALQVPTGPSSPYIPHAAALDREEVAAREAEARRYLEARAAELDDVQVETRVETTYQVARAILSGAEDTGAALVAVGTHRDSRLARVVLGSVADKVVRGAAVPVLVAHREKE